MRRCAANFGGNILLSQNASLWERGAYRLTKQRQKFAAHLRTSLCPPYIQNNKISVKSPYRSHKNNNMSLRTALASISKTAYLVAFIAFLMRLGLFMSLPFMAIYLANEKIFTAGQIGLILGISGFTLSITSLFNGMLLDRSSHRNMLIIGLFLCGVCYFSLAFSMQTLFGLLLFNGALGWFRSLTDLSSLTMIMLHSKKETLGYAYSARFVAANIGVAIGPLVGAYFSMHNSLMAFHITGMTHMLIAVYVLFYKEPNILDKEPRRPSTLLKDFHLLIKDKVLVNITLINLLLWIVYAQLDTTFPQYLTEQKTNAALTFGILMAINASICVFFQPITLRWAELTSPKICGMIGTALYALSFYLLTLSLHLWVMIIAVSLMSFGELLTLPVNGLVVMRAAPKNLIASYNGFSNLGLMGISLAPIVGGFGLQWVGGKNLFYFDMMLPIIALWLYFKSVPE